MVLNYIWIAFFLIAFVVALCKLVIGGDTEVFTHIINASFASAKTGFEISLEHAEGFSQRSDDHVPLHQCFGTDTDSGLHHDLPGTDGSDKPG